MRLTREFLVVFFNFSVGLNYFVIIYSKRGYASYFTTN